MEKLTTLASTHSHTVDRLQGVEAQLEKSTSQKASVEAREKKGKEDAAQVRRRFCFQPCPFVCLFVCL